MSGSHRGRAGSGLLRRLVRSFAKGGQVRVALGRVDGRSLRREPWPRFGTSSGKVRGGERSDEPVGGRQGRAGSGGALQAPAGRGDAGSRARMHVAPAGRLPGAGGRRRERMEKGVRPPHRVLGRSSRGHHLEGFAFRTTFSTDTDATPIRAGRPRCAWSGGTRPRPRVRTHYQ